MKTVTNRPAIAAASAVVILVVLLLLLIWLHSNAVQEWQILIAGIIALAAAFVGGAYITEQIRVLNSQVNRQIEASQNLENSKRLRKFAAARAVLPLTLGNLCEYASRCGAALKAMLGHQLDGKIPNDIEIPDLPVLHRVTEPGARIIEDECLEDDNGIRHHISPYDPGNLLITDYSRWKTPAEGQ